MSSLWPSRRWLSLILAGALTAVSALLGGQSLWIWAKACLAQRLLTAAWAETRLAGDHRRPWPWADTYPVARLRVEALDVEQIVLAGASGRTLAFGPGHLDGSAAPGEPGACILSGHRDTHFAFLERLMPGDLVELEDANRAVATYRVVETKIIDLQRTRNTVRVAGDGARLVLLTCYPFGSMQPGGPLRYLVFATKVG